MRFSHFTAAFFIVTIHVMVPLALILWTWGRSYSSITTWGVQMLVLVSYIAFIFLMGSWVFAGFYLRYAILILTLAAGIWSFIHIRNLPLFVTPHFLGWAGYGAGVLISAVLIYFCLVRSGLTSTTRRPSNWLFHSSMAHTQSLKVVTAEQAP